MKVFETPGKPWGMYFTLRTRWWLCWCWLQSLWWLPARCLPDAAGDDGSKMVKTQVEVATNYDNQCSLVVIWLVVWKIYFSPIVGMMIQSDFHIFSEGLKPPTSYE
jgi:hypothetical protein